MYGLALANVVECKIFRVLRFNTCIPPNSKRAINPKYNALQPIRLLSEFCSISLESSEKISEKSKKQ